MSYKYVTVMDHQCIEEVNTERKVDGDEGTEINKTRRYRQVRLHNVAQVKKQKLKIYFQIISILPLFLLDICYGASNGFPAILAPQLSEPCSEFMMSTNQKALIVSMDNMVAPFAAFAAGILQQKIGPKKILISCRYS